MFVTQALNEPGDNHAIWTRARAGGVGNSVHLVTSSFRTLAPSPSTNWTKAWSGATMASMSASDAAPLPRLGEVFFDVRGSSRSMRLSWYSDTGVAVFSIWQGGTCTGTFRLPIEDLSRMVEALQRGPRGAGLPAGDSATATGGHPVLGTGEGSVTPFPEYATGQHIAPVTGEFRRPDLGDHDASAPGQRSSGPQPYPEPAFRETPVYREDPLTSPSYRDAGRSSFSHRDSGEHHWSDDPRGSGSYPLPGYAPAPAAPVPAPAAPGYPDRGRSAAPYQGDRRWGDDPLGSGSYRQPSFTPSQPSGGYPDREPDGYRGQRYADDPFQSNYPDEARGGSPPYGGA